MRWLPKILVILGVCLTMLPQSARARQVEPGRENGAGNALNLFVRVDDVTEPDGARGTLATEVRRMFIEKLKQRRDVTLEAPTWLPSEGADMSAQLHQHGMRAYQASLKIQSLTTELTPLAKDPSRGTLTLTAKVRIFGNSLPNQALKIGGEGEAQSAVLVEIAHADDARSHLTHDVIDAAMQEAMSATATKIQLVAARERSGR